MATTFWMLVILGQGISTTLPVQFESQSACLAAFTGAVAGNGEMSFQYPSYETSSPKPKGWCVPIQK